MSFRSPTSRDCVYVRPRDNASHKEGGKEKRASDPNALRIRISYIWPACCVDLGTFAEMQMQMHECMQRGRGTSTRRLNVMRSVALDPRYCAVKQPRTVHDTGSHSRAVRLVSRRGMMRDMFAIGAGPCYPVCPLAAGIHARFIRWLFHRSENDEDLFGQRVTRGSRPRRPRNGTLHRPGIRPGRHRRLPGPGRGESLLGSGARAGDKSGQQKVLSTACWSTADCVGPTSHLAPGSAV